MGTRAAKRHKKKTHTTCNNAQLEGTMNNREEPRKAPRVSEGLGLSKRGPNMHILHDYEFICVIYVVLEFDGKF